MTFQAETQERVQTNPTNAALTDAATRFMQASIEAQYSYNFTWLGRPIIQYPQDILAVQEIIWKVQPDLIIETGIAHGGSIIYSASLLELNAACGGPRHSEVIGIDIDIRAHNRQAIEAHPMARRIRMLEGSSIAPEIVDRVREMAKDRHRVLVMLDSYHTHDHVLAELEAYAPLVSVGSYCVAFDTIIEHSTPAMLNVVKRDWKPGNSPETAVRAFLKRHPEFEPDREIDGKLLISVAPGGYLKRALSAIK